MASDQRGRPVDDEVPADLRKDRPFTSELGSEGGSQGALQVEEDHQRIGPGSEATTTATSPTPGQFDDRDADGGVPPGRRDE